MGRNIINNCCSWAGILLVIAVGGKKIGADGLEYYLFYAEMIFVVAVSGLEKLQTIHRIHEC